MRIGYIRRGVTLVEMLVVIVIVTILAAITLPIISGMKEKVKQTTCASNLRQLTNAIIMFQQDHGTRYPSHNTVWSDLDVPPEVMSCPTKGTDEGIGYGYNRWISGRPSTGPGMPGADSLILFADSNAPDYLLMTPTDVDPRHRARTQVAYADGRVVAIPARDVDIPLIADHELLREQVKSWPQGGHRVICSRDLGTYWNDWRVPPPPGWECNLFDVDNYGGGLFGPTMGLDMYVGLTGRPHPTLGTNWAGNPDELYLRVPVPVGARAITEEGQWLLFIPSVCFTHAGANAVIAAPAPAQITGVSRIAVLDEARAPIATFSLTLDGTRAIYACNGQSVQVLDGMAALNTAWPYTSPQRYKYAYDLDLHSLVIIGYGDGRIDCLYSSRDNPSVTGTASVPALAGNVRTPAWIELRVSTWAAAMPGNGSIVVYTAAHGGGIWWQADP